MRNFRHFIARQFSNSDQRTNECFRNYCRWFCSTIWNVQCFHLMTLFYPVCNLEFIESEKLHIPEQFLNIWLSFLVYCNEIQLLNSLFDKLIHSLANENFHVGDESQQLRNKFLFAWILTLIKYNSFKNGILFVKNHLIFSLFTIKTT